MNHDLDARLRRDAMRFPGAPHEDLAGRIADSVRRTSRSGRSPWPRRIAWTTLASAAALAVLATLRPSAAPPVPAPKTPAPQAWLDLEKAGSRRLGQSEDLLLREVVLLREDARYVIDSVLERIPARVRPLMLIDRLL